MSVWMVCLHYSHPPRFCRLGTFNFLATSLKIIDAVIDIKRDEWTAFAWAFCYFFFLLCAYYVLRPVRDEMGIQSGIKNLPWLWTGTFVGMLLITPLFGWISSRWPRRIFLPLVYFFFIANLIAFYFAFSTDAIPKTMVAPAFYIWISVFNYFVVSVFWYAATE